MNDLQREIARFLFPRLNCRQFLQDSLYRGSIQALVDEGVGGFVLFEGTVAECADAIADLREMEGERRLLLAADCEHGLTMRFEGATEFPSAWAMGAAGDPDLTQRIARAIAHEMRLVGLDWNFAPVLDANTNPENPIINLRAFGEVPERVAEHGIAYMNGMAEGGIISCGKHFPGHGDTAVDSHIGLPLLPYGVDRLQRTELVPFRQAIQAGIPAIMSAHLALPVLDSSGDPTSLSAPILSGLLRDELGFQGVIVTDALDMGAIVKAHGSDEAAVRAFLAGNDVLEIPDDPFAALEGLRQALGEGKISDGRVKEGSARLDALLQWRKTQPALDLSANWRDEHEALALEVARAGVKVSRESGTISGRHSDNSSDKGYENFVCLILRDETAAPAAERLRGLLNTSYRGTFFEVESNVAAGDRARIAQELIAALEEGNPRLILALMIRPRGGAGSVGIGEENDGLVGILRNKTDVLMNFGNPYLFRDLSVALRIDAFSSSAPSIIAALEAL